MMHCPDNYSAYVAHEKAQERSAKRVLEEWVDDFTEEDFYEVMEEYSTDE